MKRTLQRTLMVVTVFLLAAAIPLAIRANWKAGTFYLLSDQFWDDFLIRFQGAGRLRFLMQPGMAILLGIIGGRMDARRGHHGYLRRIISGHEGWRESLKHGVETISLLTTVGILADVISTILWSALGCNVAWGFVDAFMFVFSTLLERGEQFAAVRAIQKAPTEAAARQVVRDALPRWFHR